MDLPAATLPPPGKTNAAPKGAAFSLSGFGAGGGFFGVAGFTL
jgi:hypothetical protein